MERYVRHMPDPLCMIAFSDKHYKQISQGEKEEEEEVRGQGALQGVYCRNQLSGVLQHGG